MSINQLRKKRYTGRGNADKYYIDCGRYAKNPESIEIETVLKNTKTPTVTILKAVATDETIRKKNRNIVVKISRTADKETKEYMAHKEYRIGKALSGINGFINYICIFGCFDDTHNKIQTSEFAKICDADDKIEKNWNYVLVMPYIQEGSIENYNWTKENVEILKMMVMHTVMSLATAFEKVGFIHQDLHLQNVLFKKTKRQEIEYVLSSGNRFVFPTMGYKVVIMDFEKAVTGVKDTYHFWNDLSTFLRNVDSIRTNMNRIVEWDDSATATQFAKNMRKGKTAVEHVGELIQIIAKSSFDVIELPPKIEYNSNIY
jgi:serine/threonine protein kinase